MTEEQKARRSDRQKTIIRFTKEIGKSYLGLRLTPGQIKAAARTFYYIKLKEALEP